MDSELLRDVPVRLNRLAEALETYEGGMEELAWFLDIETGAVEMWLGNIDSFAVGEGEDEESVPPFDEDPERYRELPKSEKRSDFRLMERFLAEVRDVDPDIAEELDRALSGRDAFRRFRQTVDRWADWRRRWLAFRTNHFIEEARLWLEENGLRSTIEWSPPEPQSPPPQKKEKEPNPGLLELLIYGGKAEILAGKAHRCVMLPTAETARRMFVTTAKDICRWH